MGQSLGDRTRNALTREHIRRAEASELLEENRAAQAEAEATAAAAEKRMEDPLVPAKDAQQAKSEAEYWHLEGRRAAAAVALLTTKLEEIDAATERNRAEQAAKAMRERRDVLAAEIKDRVPRLLDELHSFAERIRASDAEIAGTGLQSAETVARGLARTGASAPLRLTALKLPQFAGTGTMPTGAELARVASLQRIDEQNRRQILREEEARKPENIRAAAEKEAAQWRCYRIGQAPYIGHPIGPVPTRAGPRWLYEGSDLAEMRPEDVKAAQKRLPNLGAEEIPADWGTYRLQARERGSVLRVLARFGILQVGNRPVDCELNAVQALTVARTAGLRAAKVEQGEEGEPAQLAPLAGSGEASVRWAAQ